MQRIERGQVTAEYTVGLLGAVTIATILIHPGSPVAEALHAWLEDYVQRVLSVPLPDLFRWPW